MKEPIGDGTQSDPIVADLSPSDRAVGWLRRRWESASFSGNRVVGHELGRRILITLGLLLLWQAAHFIPLPVLDWRAMEEFFHQYGDGLPALLYHVSWREVSVLSSGYEPFLLAHLILFWFVMIIAPLRKMGFAYRRSLDFHTVALAFLVAVLLGIGRLAWCLNLVSPLGHRFVSPYFGTHLVVFRVVGLCALLAGFGFTLFVLKLIRRYGLPFPLTCLVAWDILFPVARQLLTLRADALQAGDPQGLIRGATLAISILALGLGLLAAYWIYTGHVTEGTGGKESLGGKARGLFAGEPSLLVFGLLSTGVLMGCWRVARVALPLFGEGGLRLSARLDLPQLQDAFADRVLSYGVPLGLGLLSTLLFHRFFYNRALRDRLGQALQSPVNLARQAVWRALGCWCLLFALVTMGAFLRHTFFPSYPLLKCLAAPFSWEVVFLLIAAVGFVLYARNSRQGFVAPVYTHGYYEPLYAVKALLGENGIPAVFGGEPYALLHGIIVGPVARKELLVREADRGRALELLEQRGVLGERATSAPRWTIHSVPEPTTVPEQPEKPSLHNGS